MRKSKQSSLTSGRNSSIELLKIFGIILIVISHVIQTLHTPSSHVASNDYVLDISIATTDIQRIILALLRHSGSLGNTIFFCCSAWFLLDDDKVNKKKILQMLLDVWIVSIIILLTVYIIRSGNIDSRTIIKQIFPTTFEANWYITCYILFYPLHSFLNHLIKKMNQKTLLRVVLVLLFLYVFVNYILPGKFYTSAIVLWVTLYFAMAYMKYFLTDLSNNIKINILLLIVGFLGTIGMVLITNFLGLYIESFNGKLLRWSSNCSPFLILIAVSMLNIARNVQLSNKVVNYISSLSLLIYIFHENALLRSFYRPLMWSYVYLNCGYEYILLWVFVLVLIVFAFGLITSIIYKSTIQKLVTIVCNWLYSFLRKVYKKIENLIIKLH